MKKMQNVPRFSIPLVLLLAAFITWPTLGHDEYDYDYDVADPPEADALVDPPSFVGPDEVRTSHSSPGYRAFLDHCSNQMTLECGKQVFEAMFEDTFVTRECCMSLLQMGLRCHVALVNNVLRTYEKGDAEVGLQRSRVAWNNCARGYGKEIGAPVPLESI